MSDEQPPAPGRLTSFQQTRREFARRDYEKARTEDLAQMEEAALILLVERLRNRLGDVLELVDEVSAASAPPPPPSGGTDTTGRGGHQYGV